MAHQHLSLKINLTSVRLLFKRALGHLMKAELIVQEDGWTLLTEKGQATLLEADEQSATVEETK